MFPELSKKPICIKKKTTKGEDVMRTEGQDVRDWI